MSVQQWIESLEKVSNDEFVDLTPEARKDLKKILQERLNVAEELYELNRRLSICIATTKVLEEKDIMTLNFELGKIIKKLRGNN